VPGRSVTSTGIVCTRWLLIDERNGRDRPEETAGHARRVLCARGVKILSSAIRLIDGRVTRRWPAHRDAPSCGPRRSQHTHFFAQRGLPLDLFVSCREQSRDRRDHRPAVGPNVAGMACEP
jgi:hypothetical protein